MDTKIFYVLVILFLLEHISETACQKGEISYTDILSLGSEVYTFAYPIVLVELTKKAIIGQGHLKINEFLHLTDFPTLESHAVVRPNVDTLYSISFLDLSKGPVILNIPDTYGRYYIIQVMDAWTNVFASIGKRTTGTQKQKYVFTGPFFNETLPENLKDLEIKSPTSLVFIIGRIQTNGESDIENVVALQKRLFIGRLGETKQSVFARGSSEAQGVDPSEIVNYKLNPIEFLSIFGKSLGLNPISKDDIAEGMSEKLEKLGVIPGNEFSANKLSLMKRNLLNQTFVNGRNAFLINGKNEIPLINGWRMKTSGIGKYDTNYTFRAFIAYFGLGANLPEDAVYPSATKDINGNGLNGKNKYLIHFSKEQIPRVKAFWSLTLYDSNGFLVENPINRYALGDRDLLISNQDGSLDIYIQKEAPVGYETNWLPCVEEVFSLSLRLYWPDESVLNGQWKPPIIKINNS